MDLCSNVMKSKLFDILCLKITVKAFGTKTHLMSTTKLISESQQIVFVEYFMCLYIFGLVPLKSILLGLALNFFKD